MNPREWDRRFYNERRDEPIALTALVVHGAPFVIGPNFCVSAGLAARAAAQMQSGMDRSFRVLWGKQ